MPGSALMPQMPIDFLVFPATLRTNTLPAMQRQAHATLADPPDSSRRHTDHEGKVRNVAGHHRAGADERIRPERDAADDRCVGPDRGSPADDGLAIFVLAGDVTAGVHHVCEDAARAAEDVVF